MKKLTASVLLLAPLALLAIACSDEMNQRVTNVEARVAFEGGRIDTLQDQNLGPTVVALRSTVEAALPQLQELTRDQMVEVFSELYGLQSRLDEKTKFAVREIRTSGMEAWAREFLAQELEVPPQELKTLNSRLTGVQKDLEARPVPAPTPRVEPTSTPTSTQTPTPAATATPTPTPTPTPVPTATATPTPTPTATLVPAPIVLPAPAATSTPEVPKETVFTLKLEAEKEGDKVLAILSNLRGKFEDPGCPKESLIQPAEASSELRRCLTTKSRLMEWLGISTLPATGREWLVLDQTIFKVTAAGEKPLKRQPAFWFQVRPSTDTRLMVELEAGAVKLEGLAEPGGEKIEPNGRVLSKEGYLAWIQRWTKKEPPSHRSPGIYAVYPFLLER